MIYFYGGAFNPMTVTHQEIIADLIANMTDKDRLVIAITTHDYKTYQFPYEVRKEIITKNLARIPAENKKIRMITVIAINIIPKHPIYNRYTKT
mgnify:CR=1 FL=1